MRRVSENEFDAVVIGSGFGGGASARSLAARGLKVLVLERGRLYPPGSFPRNPHALARNVWDPKAGLYGLFDLWTFRSLDALVASGVGGGSLIYANVLLRKSAETFVQHGADGEDWPVTREDLDVHYDAIERELAAQPYPFDRPPYDRARKTALLKSAAERLKLTWLLPKLAVAFGNSGEAPQPGIPIKEKVPNLHGRIRLTCTLCGECDIGCNVGAKSTVDHTLISRAIADGAELRHLAEVRSIKPGETGGYEVGYADLRGAAGDERPTDAAPLIRVRSQMVVLAAGTLGSTFLLLRNRNNLPKLSPALGSRFSSNGDLLAFIKGRSDPAVPGSFVDSSLGPVITSTIAVPGAAGEARREYFVQDGGLPLFGGWLVEAASLPAILRRMAALLRNYMRRLLGGNPDSNLSEELGTALGRGAGHRWTVPLLGMGRDVAGGRMALRKGFLDIDWPSLPSRRYFETVRKTMRRLADAMNARLSDNPLWILRRTITVHPLGGCPMGRDRNTGVVDSFGEVFGHPGLIVADGSVMPGPVGANPSLTIAAIARRFAEAAADRLIAQRRVLENDSKETVP